jgi:hypothetical protein
LYWEVRHDLLGRLLCVSNPPAPNRTEEVPVSKRARKTKHSPTPKPAIVVCPCCEADLSERDAVFESWSAYGIDRGHVENGYFVVDSEEEEERSSEPFLQCAGCREALDEDALGVER